ncbi:hypothetical protein CFSAN002237_23995 [Escherichia coli O104:H21 str. CFSAN002237]|nr:hypothetical protein CFSAN002237_23995 [Escherichia coli O104:H21 str. CFSAN002237]
MTITVSVVRRAFSSIVHPGTGLPAPSFSTPDILTAMDFLHKKPQDRFPGLR